MNLAAILADAHFTDLKGYVLGHTGLAYYNDKNEDLAARLALRMGVLHAANCRRYLEILEGLAGAHEMDRLVGELTIGETYFFRQVEHFDLLRSTIIPGLLEQNAEGRRIRIWSAGCATGEEPYSIAVLLEREFGNRLAGWDVSILATDINNEFLTRAKEARYSEWAFRATPHEIREQCFDRRGKTWTLRPEYRNRVAFQRLNLAAEHTMFSPANVFDLIVCRNVMIYFAADLIQRTVTRFREALLPGGWLIVGHAEFNPTLFAEFARVCVAGVSAYRNLVSGVAAPQPEPCPPSPVLAEHKPASRSKSRKSALPAAAPVAAPAPAMALQEVRDLADRGLWQAAAALGMQLTESDPLSAPAHFTLGLILESAASPQEAEPALRRAIYLDRNFALAHYHLANCLQSTGKREQARRSLQNVVQLLTNRPAGERVEHGDGMTVADLNQMAKLHLEILEARERRS
jgi:chemotaxis protein methyltransferase CheR